MDLLIEEAIDLNLSGISIQVSLTSSKYSSSLSLFSARNVTFVTHFAGDVLTMSYQRIYLTIEHSSLGSVLNYARVDQ